VNVCAGYMSAFNFSNGVITATFVADRCVADSIFRGTFQ
jgi:hypothetical protein